MSNSIFGIGVSGLAAAQAGLVTTGHNIANANTPGYHRQTIEQSAQAPVLTGSGFFGQGAKVDTVARAYDQFLESQVAQTGAQAAYSSTYHAQLAHIDDLLGAATTGISPVLQDFFGSAQSVAASPSSVPARQIMVSAGATLVSRFNTLAAQINEVRTSINSEITSSVSQVNAYAQQIATLNGRILSTQSDPTQPPNDLLDQRDALVGKVNQLIGANALQQNDGTINLFIGTGQSIVVGVHTMTLAAIPSVDDPLRTEIGYVTPAGTARLDSASLPGGSLGALLAFRANDLDGAQNELGVIALGLTQTFNQQQRLGQDLTGALGADFFTAPAPSVVVRTGNTGTAVIGASVADPTALVASDYLLSYATGSYTLTRLSDGTSNNYATLPQTVDGVTITLGSGAPASGDSFLIRPTYDAARLLAMNLSDPRSIAAAAPVRAGASAANAGTATISAGTVNAPPPVNANLQQPVTITFTGAATFNVTGTGTSNPTGVAYTSGASISYNGWTVQISGTPAVGDVFTVVPNTGGVADGRNASLLAGLQTQNLLNGGTTNYQGAYSRLVSAVGSKAQQLSIAAEANTALADAATQAQQSLVGVNLDEEAANLLRYQQAYQAAGKLIQITSTLFDTLLSLGNG